jgi:glyoxylase I family protein
MPEDLAETLRRLEVALASANPAGVEGGLPALIPDDFLEFGASGRTWDADAIREALARSPAEDPEELLDFTVAELAPGVVLATYRLGQPRPSNRSTVWLLRGGRWQVRFHQGTLRAE